MEGKTTVLTNLGIAAAERKQRVLLIDADLRRPRVHELVNVSNAWGLADLLKRSDFEEFSKQAAVEDLFRPTHIPNLSVLPGGAVEMTSPSLLYASDLSPLLERFREEFDLILIDTPPMMLYADGRLLGRLSEGVVMVVRAATRTREELQAAYLRLVQDQIPVLGTILNDWKMDRSEASMYGRYHQHYYPPA
jgi:receptor protein-tyrosine kinase